MPVLEKNKLNEFLSQLSHDHRVYAPSQAKDCVKWRRYQEGVDVKLDYETTTTSPKHLFFPPRERILEYQKDEVDVLGFDESQILFGAHLYDVQALEILDKVFTDEYVDNYYARRRENTLVVAVNHGEVPNAFYHELGLELNEGYDLYLQDGGDRYDIVVGSKEGEKLLDSPLIREGEAPDMDLPKHDSQPLNLEEIKDFLDKGPDQELWHRLAEECFACGACSYVCPICHCFDIQDRMNLDMESGYRMREWDSCMLADFAAVAGGGNFREERYKRIHNWYHHKFSRAIEERGVPDCVGCGRCITVCPAEIQIHDVLKECEANG